VLLIQPTSTASQRVFSVAENFQTKIRSRMKFRVLNALLFLFMFEFKPVTSVFGKKTNRETGFYKVQFFENPIS
jgi:hypothetical protein